MTIARTRVKRDLLVRNMRKRSTRESEVIDPSTGEMANGVDGSKKKKVEKGKGRATQHQDDMKPEEGVFEVVVLGSGGGPLETDVSGYLLKPLNTRWEDGFIAIEGGSGIGSLADLIDRHGSRSLFPSVDFPKSHSTALLKAAYLFSFLSCYVLTHTHLDHCLSLILLSGSMPPRPQPPVETRIPSPPLTSQQYSPPSTIPLTLKGESSSRPPIRVYGTQGTLQKLSLAYGGELWPELVEWETGKDIYARRKSLGSQAGSSHHGDGGGPSAEMLLSPLPPDSTPITLDPALTLAVRQFELAHGCTSKGSYDSTALFIRSTLPQPTTLQPNGASRPLDNGPDPAPAPQEREILFFGDVESSYRPSGSEDINPEGRDRAERCNARIWKDAAKIWSEGRLAGIFIECSYDSERPIELMFGHMSPLGVIHELGIMANEMMSLGGVSKHNLPLSGLKVYITHIKQYLVPHPSGLTANERIMAQLGELEEERKLGIEFVEVKRGMRIVL